MRALTTRFCGQFTIVSRHFLRSRNSCGNRACPLQTGDSGTCKLGQYDKDCCNRLLHLRFRIPVPRFHDDMLHGNAFNCQHNLIYETIPDCRRDNASQLQFIPVIPPSTYRFTFPLSFHLPLVISSDARNLKSETGLHTTISDSSLCSE